MTEDYKKNLIDYATGNITPGTPTTNEIFKEEIEANRDKWTDFLPSGWEDFHLEDIIKDNKTNKYVLYGGYRARGSQNVDDEVYGIIILLDEELNPYKSIFEFDSGTPLRSILLMNQAEDGTYYMIDDTSFTNYRSLSVNNNPRFVMLNNIVNEEKATLRTSYILPYRENQDIAYFFTFRKLEKNPNQAQYIIITDYEKFNAHGSQGGGLLAWFNGVCCIELKIPYGESPVWTWTEIAKGRSSQSDPFSTGYYRASFIQFNEDKYMIKAICSSEVNNIMGYRYYYKNYNDNSYTITLIKTFNDSLRIFNKTILEQQEIFINENECYFVESNLERSLSVEGIIELYYYNTNTNTLTTIYSNTYPAPPSQSYNRSEAIFLAQNQGKLYIQYIVKKDTNIYDYYMQRYEGTWQPILVGENKPCISYQRAFYVNNNYNLIKIFVYPNNPRGATWYWLNIKEVYNPNQYNGESYVSVDSLAPLLSNLYSNGSIMFSRNLYNISKQNNMTMSSVEIPNTYLNDTTITQNDLISETNQELVNDNKQWNKNIYEVVDLNFLNTINVIDEDTNTPYLESAIKLNNATTDGGNTNYQNTPCNKFRINYLDGTTSTDNFSWSSIDSTHKEATISLYVDKTIVSIDLLSHDLSTTYLTIPLNVEVGKTYSITQKVRVE